MRGGIGTDLTGWKMSLVFQVSLRGGIPVNHFKPRFTAEGLIVAMESWKAEKKVNLFINIWRLKLKAN